MNRSELITLVVTSSEKYAQTQFIPWWEGNVEDLIYYGDIIEKDTVEEAEACLAELTKEELLSPAGSGGFPLFHLLIWLNFHDAVRKMLSDGRITAADIDTPDCGGQGITPLMLACARGNLPMVKLLLHYGADTSLKDNRGMNMCHFLAYPRLDTPKFDATPLERSVEQRGEIARLLTCDMNEKNRDGLAPLELLLSTEYSASYTWPLAEVFLEKGSDTGYTDEAGNTLLLMALRNRHYTAALTLMKHCPEIIDTPNATGRTPIQNTIDFQNEAMYLALIDHGAVTGPDQNMELFPISQITSNAFCDVRRDDMDPLSLALFMTEKMLRQLDPEDDEIGEFASILYSALTADPKARVLDMCLNAGVDFTMPLYYRGSSLCLRDECIHRCRGIDVLKKLGAKGVDMNRAVIKGQTPVYILASTTGQMDDEEDFWREAAAFFSKDSMEQRSNDGKAALHLAAKNGHLFLLQAMLEKGADVNLTEDAPASAGATALHEACRYGHADIVKLLINAGADDTAKNEDGETPAHLVLKKTHYRSSLNSDQKACLLKELNALDLPDETGKTPFMLLDHTDAELLPLFLDRGVDVNRQDQDGMTAMMLYIDKDMTKELLQAGADLHLADKDGNTVLHHALECGSQDTARYLIRKGADYNRPNNQGITPVHLAVENGFELVLELMTDIV